MSFTRILLISSLILYAVCLAWEYLSPEEKWVGPFGPAIVGVNPPCALYEYLEDFETKSSRLVKVKMPFTVIKNRHYILSCEK